MVFWKEDIIIFYKLVMKYESKIMDNLYKIKNHLES